jgi:hypothetical protein
MNHILENYARQYIKDMISFLPHGYQEKFKLMYGRTTGLKSGTRSVEDTKSLPLETIIDDMSSDKLDWAMIQIENSYKKLLEKEHD